MQIFDLQRALADVEAVAARSAAHAHAEATPRRVFLHGFAGAPATFAQLTAALAASPSNAETAPPHCPALPGHQAPPPPATGGWRHTVEALCAALPTGPVHLLGYSLGARLALAMALTHPGRVRLLTLVGVNPGLPNVDERAERRRQDLAWQRCLQQRGLQAFFKDWQAQPLFASQAHLDPEVRAAQTSQRAALHAEELAATLGRLGLAAMPNYWPRLARLQVPTLLVAGSLDTKFVALHRRASRLLPHGTLAEVPGVGHNAVLEAPQALAQLVLAHEGHRLPEAS